MLTSSLVHHSHAETPPHSSHHTLSVVISRDISITEALFCGSLQFAQHKVRLVPRCYMGTLHVVEELTCILK